MKRLLIGPALVLPLLTLGFCGKSPELPKVPEVIPIDNFDQRFPVPPLNPPAVLPKEKPNVRRVHPPAASPERPRVHGRSLGPRLTDRPHHPAAPVVKEEPLPPQQGVICIFPFSLIPSCTPGVP